MVLVALMARLPAFRSRTVGKLPRRVPLFVALPDIGLIGVLSATHLIYKLSLPMVSYVISDILPQINVVVKGAANPAIRVHANEKLAVFVCDVPLPMQLWPRMARLAVYVAQKIQAPFLVGATGLPIEKRHELTELKTYYIFSRGMPNVEQLREDELYNGTIFGPYASLINESIVRDVPYLIAVTESFPAYPDPEAAGVTLMRLLPFLKVEVDVDELISKGSEIRLLTRELARSTVEEARKAVGPSLATPSLIYG